MIKALAHPARREILTWLKDPAGQFPGQTHSFEFGVCAGQIHAKAGLSCSTVSAHLACLQRAGLVSTRKLGQWIFYTRDEAAISAFLQHMQHTLQSPLEHQT
ncbi:MAG: transcriptional regulator [Candidatus Dactylopiibacterium carminicum]|uniref:Transcriptional regulator n=1 Tax=Candidatus Dactylopiibacterium carminicum TaxID=857335 RepID=A0A272EMW3_9RHOO|nr:transcriptional regulator [Candidatus Dactylopiibacterium carminicum]PAS91441.1 MAG: transcriptional regulator [Candidatus Dactylopiibacterium carminicum]PAS95715.1 MAG: transcriptional regulator [Candidatus Dactylopiibacterium carminicum]